MNRRNSAAYVVTTVLLATALASLVILSALHLLQCATQDTVRDLQLLKVREKTIPSLFTHAIIDAPSDFRGCNAGLCFSKLAGDIPELPVCDPAHGCAFPELIVANSIPEACAGASSKTDPLIFPPERGALRAPTTCSFSEYELRDRRTFNENVFAENALTLEEGAHIELDGALHVNRMIVPGSATLIAGGNIFIQRLVLFGTLNLVSATGRVTVAESAGGGAIRIISRRDSSIDVTPYTIAPVTIETTSIRVIGLE